MHVQFSFGQQPFSLMDQCWSLGLFECLSWHDINDLKPINGTFCSILEENVNVLPYRKLDEVQCDQRHDVLVLITASGILGKGIKMTPTTYRANESFNEASN